MNQSNHDTDTFMAWIFSRGNWWDIICGDVYDASDKLLKEILLKLVEESKYELAFVLLKTHEGRQSVEHAITKTIAEISDEPFTKHFLRNVANHLGTQKNPHSA